MYFKSTRWIRQQLFREQKESGAQRCRVLRAEVDVRWNSTASMVSRLLELWDAVNCALEAATASLDLKLKQRTEAERLKERLTEVLPHLQALDGILSFCMEASTRMQSDRSSLGQMLYQMDLLETAFKV